MVKKQSKNGQCGKCTGCGNCNKKGVANRNIRAYYMPDPYPENPFEAWDTAGTQLWKDDSYRYSNRFRGRKGETLDMFCNSKFDLYRFEDELDFSNEDEMCEYLKHFGCIAVPLYGGRYGGFDGLVVIGQDGIKKEWGDPKNKKNRKIAKEVLKGEAKCYEQAAEGDVYGYVITDDGDDMVQDPFELKYVYDYKDIEGDDIDSCWGYYGEDTVEEEAKDAWEYAVKKKDERIAKESRMAPKERRYTITQTKVQAPSNARAIVGGMKVGESRTMRDGSIITRTANRKRAPAKRSVIARRPRW